MDRNDAADLRGRDDWDCFRTELFGFFVRVFPVVGI